MFNKTCTSHSYLRTNVSEHYIDPASSPHDFWGSGSLSRNQYCRAMKDVSSLVNKNTHWVAKATTWEYRSALFLPLGSHLCSNGLNRTPSSNYRTPQTGQWENRRKLSEHTGLCPMHTMRATKWKR